MVRGSQVDPQVHAAVRASETPLIDPPLCTRLGRLGTDAVEPLTLDVKRPSGVGDLFVETVEPPQGLGMLVLEVHVGVATALEVDQVPLGLGQVDLQPGPLGARQRLEALSQRSYLLGGPVRPLTQPVTVPQPDVLGLGQAGPVFLYRPAPGDGRFAQRRAPPLAPSLGLVQVLQLPLQVLHGVAGPVVGVVWVGGDDGGHRLSLGHQPGMTQADTAGTDGAGSAPMPGAGVPWSMAQPMRREWLQTRHRSSAACSGESATT